MTVRSRILALSLAVFLAAPLAMGGPAGATGTEQSKPAGQIAVDSAKAMLGAKNFHVRGFINQGAGPVTLNITTSPNGGGGALQWPGATMQLVVAGQKVYVKADEKSWVKLTGSKPTAEQLANRWAEAPDTNPNFKNLAGITNPRILLGELTSGWGKLSKLSVITNWAGHEALILQTKQGGRLYVVDGPVPYMLHLQEGHGASSASISFSDFGTAPMPSVPVKAIAFPTTKTAT